MSGGESPDDLDDEDAGLSEGDYERIAEFNETDPDLRGPDILVPNGGSPAAEVARDRSRGVSAQTCITMRRRMSEAETVREVMEEYPRTHTSEVMKHVYGECHHSHDVPATASPQISAWECRMFRNQYATGDDVAEISAEFYRADNTVTRHIFGRCSHAGTARTESPSGVQPWECDRLRRTYVGNEKVSVEGAATAMRLRPEVAATHLFGYCGCEGNAPPAEEVEEW